MLIHRAVLVAAVTLAVAPATVAAATPCSPAVQPTLKITDVQSKGTLYATHTLKVTGSVGDDSSPRVSAPGAIALESASSSTSRFVRDTPGPLTFHASFITIEPSDDPNGGPQCTATVTQTVDLAAPSPLGATWVKPRRLRRNPDRYAYTPTFRLTLRTTPTSSLLPVTVKLRVSRRFGLPSPNARLVSRTYDLRHLELKDGSDSDPEEASATRSRCGSSALVCPREVRSWPSGVAVYEFDVANSFTRGVRFEVRSPTGVPGPNFRRTPTPWGIAFDAFQAGERIAKLRAAVRCDSFGQVSGCRFKNVSTRP